VEYLLGKVNQVKFESRAYMKSKIFFKTKNGALRETAPKNQIPDLNLNNRPVELICQKMKAA
jgi:hypothetical protein